MVYFPSGNKNEGSQLVTKCDQLKMQSADGKFYETDAADNLKSLKEVRSLHFSRHLYILIASIHHIWCIAIYEKYYFIRKRRKTDGKSHYPAWAAFKY